MMVFAGYIATSALALLMIWGVLLWGVNRTAGVRNILGLFFGLCASYWVGLALDVSAKAY